MFIAVTSEVLKPVWRRGGKQLYIDALERATLL